ncbi:KdsC family phosphatase [Zeimonas arvi]|uniref:3-deoxy-D-manno-octulosonate 8-phosphate phosphatase KdsC n=1 Tax=Zeimonas arvi TaxID=2498847 RepID=A0A5C8NWM6_9BURK|nr:HAD family hydrolase [Zeimonas arvi]TXL65472.1 3-deoxy-D-manno-octulosonate 8-phosphate phosphatase [Zeimonas arvi]
MIEAARSGNPRSPSDARARAAAIRLLALDVDGTLTDGRINIGPEGEAMKSFSVRDGFGLTLLREAGIRLAVITARRSAIVEHRARELEFDHVLQGVGDKASALAALRDEHRLAPAEAGFVGDDWPDLPAMLSAGFAAAPADAAPEVRDRAHWVSSAPAGHGAIRELAEFVLRARGEFETALARRLGRTAP